jgi:uncharacterized protein
MRVALFGATGRTGRRVLELALGRHWPTRALVRDRRRLPVIDGLTVVEGDARAATDAGKALAGVAAVLCCLGMRDITVPATDFSDSVRAIVRAMAEQGVRRIVAIGSIGVLDHPLGGYRNQHGLPPPLRHVSAEHVRNCETLRASGLDWTLLCPGNLVDDLPAGRGRLAIEDVPSGAHETGYADLAAAMIDVLNEAATVNKRVGVLSARE